MLTSEIKIGGVYSMRHHEGNLILVEILGTKLHTNYNGLYRPSINRTYYRAINLVTGRDIIVKSAAKLRSEYVQLDSGEFQAVNNPRVTLILSQL